MSPLNLCLSEGLMVEAFFLYHSFSISPLCKPSLILQNRSLQSQIQSPPWWVNCDKPLPRNSHIEILIFHTMILLHHRGPFRGERERERGSCFCESGEVVLLFLSFIIKSTQPHICMDLTIYNIHLTRSRTISKLLSVFFFFNNPVTHCQIDMKKIIE